MAPVRIFLLLVLIVHFVGFSTAQGYSHLGCWRDTGNRAVPQIDGSDRRIQGNYQKRVDAVNKCFQVARERKLVLFAVQNGGWCAAADNLNGFKKYGRSGKCRNGKGGPWANDVYRITITTRTPLPKAEFKFSTAAQTWSVAENNCRSWGGHIATPTNHAENNRLWSNIRNRRGYGLTWLGTSDITSEGRWISTQTGRPVTYAPWNRGEPNGRRGENCGMMWASSGLWNDVGCHARLQYVCQRKRSPPPSPSRVQVTYLIKNNKTLSFKCQFSRNDVKPSTYIVSWYTSSSSSKIYSQTLNSGDVSIMPERSDNPFYQLGTSVYCKVHYWFNDNPSLVSLSVTSNRFYAGVEVTPTNFNIVSKGKPIEVKVKLTVPIICKTGENNCSIAVQLASPRKDILVTCPNNLVFTAATWNIVQTVTVKTKADTKHIAAVKVSIKVTIIPQSTVLLWANHTQIIVTITRLSISSGGKAGRCISTGDPHLRTFDGFTYDHYRIGDYVLVKSKIRDFEVHVRTHRCYTVSCNCGVVVKEGSDVMAINFCGNFYSPFVGYLSKKEPQPGTGIERGGNGRSFTLRLASGAFITFSTYPYGGSSYSNIAVHIPSIDFRQTVGMCGIFDGNSGNDQSKPNGQNVGGRGSPAFTESWRLTQSDSLFFYKETVTTTTGVTATVDICLPTLTCSFEEKKLKAGHKLLGFPGLAECDKKRGKKPDPDIIVTPSGGGDGSKGVVDPDNSTFVPVVPTWPTKSGITLPDATSKCKTHLEGSATFQTCRKLLGVQFITKFSATLHQCIADIQIIDDKVVAFSGALQALRDICQKAVDERPEDMKELEDKVCPNECSGHGRCIKGACVCNKGFTTEDCSVDLNQVPELLNVGCGHICDVRTSDCNNVVIRSTKLVPDRVQCRDGVHLSSAKVLNFAEVICPLEKTSDKFLSKHGGVPIARYDVYLSNDGKNFSTRAMPVTVYDSKCMSCDKNCEAKQVKCTLKANTCLIAGRCYTNGEVDLTDKKCGLCDPAQSTSKFVKRNGWGPWKEWSSCSKSCNGGVQKRIRVCLNSCCNGKTEETRHCNQHSCHVDVDTGFCTSVTEEECAAIAMARKIPLIEIRNPNLYLFPRGCYHKQTNDKIYYNVVKSKKACSRKRICICKNVKQMV